MTQHRSKVADPAFALVLKQARQSAGKTQAQTAEALGADVATIANWEHARSEPKASQITRLALFYGLAAGDLFRAQVSEIPPPPESGTGPRSGVSPCNT